jgi:hypothetical protein
MDLPTGLIACPSCGRVHVETFPPNACLYFFQCRECGTIVRPKPGDGCAFRSFGRPRECPGYLADVSMSNLTH